MPFADIYRRQVELLIRALPLVTAETCFALKGGTAINLFFRDLPRLSVDIDLTYLPVAPRVASLADIDRAMKRIEVRIKDVLPGAKSQRRFADGSIVKLVIRSQSIQIKIEVTPVLRGCVFDPELRVATPAVEDAFGFVEARVVSFADLYAGKIVAALDRQHPRDLFDIRDLLAAEGITSDLRQAFIVYLVSHDRPMSEVLAPTLKDITHEFSRGFAGMTQRAVAIEELIAARKRLIEAVVHEMPAAHRGFLVSFERGEPDWSLLGAPHAAKLPAVLWRRRNLDLLPASKRDALVRRLEGVLGGSS